VFGFDVDAVDDGHDNGPDHVQAERRELIRNLTAVRDQSLLLRPVLRSVADCVQDGAFIGQKGIKVQQMLASSFCTASLQRICIEQRIGPLALGTLGVSGKD
jgi:hypothetical protein